MYRKKLVSTKQMCYKFLICLKFHKIFSTLIKSDQNDPVTGNQFSMSLISEWLVEDICQPVVGIREHHTYDDFSFCSSIDWKGAS